MAFLNRVSGLLKQTVSNHGCSKLCVANPSFFQAIRNMSGSSQVFVGGISYGTDEASLRETFGKYGDVLEAKIIMDRDTGRSRGFAFVTFTSSESASNAIQAYDGQELHGRRIRVNYATEKPRGGFAGDAGGGFSNGGQGGNYGGGYQGGSYRGSGGGYNSVYSGDINQYQSGSGGNSYPSGGGNSYGGGDSMAGDGNFSGSNLFSGGSFSSPPANKVTGMYGNQLGTGAENDDFGNLLNGNDRDEDDEPKDFVNSR